MQFQYLITGYRAACDDPRAALRSMVSGGLHNETLNGWSTVLASAIVAYLTISDPNPKSAHWIILAALLVHMPVSFMYHAMTCSPKYGPLLRAADVAAVLLVCNVVCAVAWSVIQGYAHLKLLTGATVAALFAVMLMDAMTALAHHFRGGVACSMVGVAQRNRATCFIGAAVLMYNVPFAIVGLASHVYGDGAAAWARVEMVAVTLAAVFYATCFPEALWPRRFDLVGSSHNWAHVLLCVQQVAIWNVIRLIC